MEPSAQPNAQAEARVCRFAPSDGMLIVSASSRRQ